VGAQHMFAAIVLLSYVLVSIMGDLWLEGLTRWDDLRFLTLTPPVWHT
jgi:hypothetical protein